MAIRLKFRDNEGKDKLLVCDAVNLENGLVEGLWKMGNGFYHVRSYLAVEPVSVRRLYSGLRDVIGRV